jgi:hypothetical protein
MTARTRYNDGSFHPIPVALTELHDLGGRWLAWRLAVDL